MQTTSSASGNLAPAATANRAEPAPGSITRFGGCLAAAHSTIARTIDGGV